MPTYRVKVNGKQVWKHQTKTYEGTGVFPDEYRQQRPEKGVVQLLVDDEVIANMRPEADEEGDK